MGRPLRINKAEPRSPGGGGGGAPRRGGYGGGGGYSGGGGYEPNRAPEPRGDRPSGAQGWEDRSYGSQNDSFGEGRTRRRRSSYQGD